MHQNIFRLNVAVDQIPLLSQLQGMTTLVKGYQDLIFLEMISLFFHNSYLLSQVSLLAQFHYDNGYAFFFLYKTFHIPNNILMFEIFH